MEREDSIYYFLPIVYRSACFGQLAALAPMACFFDPEYGSQSPCALVQVEGEQNAPLWTCGVMVDNCRLEVDACKKAPLH
jgi:hypothetical protein